MVARRSPVALAGVPPDSPSPCAIAKVADGRASVLECGTPVPLFPCQTKPDETSIPPDSHEPSWRQSSVKPSRLRRLSARRQQQQSRRPPYAGATESFRFKFLRRIVLRLVGRLGRGARQIPPWPRHVTQSEANEGSGRSLFTRAPVTPLPRGDGQPASQAVVCVWASVPALCNQQGYGAPSMIWFPSPLLGNRSLVREKRAAHPSLRYIQKAGFASCLLVCKNRLGLNQRGPVIWTASSAEYPSPSG